MSVNLKVLMQYILPKQAITVCAGKLANLKGGWLTSRVIIWFVERYQVDMNEAAETDPHKYATFNAFFTRALRSGVRPTADSDFICPVDGAISQFGAIEKDLIFQAKGHYYSIESLLAGNKELAETFLDGDFATLYLSPKDYHRIHMPVKGLLKSMAHVPGTLFSVNPETALGIPGLFAKNERVICEFSSDFGSFAMVLVGATIVGSISTAWHGVVNSKRKKSVTVWDYQDSDIELDKGDEMGRFMLGSTVILVFPKHTLEFASEWFVTKPIRLGEKMGSLTNDLN